MLQALRGATTPPLLRHPFPPAPLVRKRLRVPLGGLRGHPAQLGRLYFKPAELSAVPWPSLRKTLRRAMIV